MRRLLAALALVPVLAACGQPAAPAIPVVPVSMTLTDSSTGFGLTLLDRLLAEQGAGNVFISPLSATIALSMAASATHGDTRAAILKVLGIDPAANADEQARETITRLAQSDPNAQVELAQAAWAQNGMQLNPAYVQRLKQYYQADLSNLDFTSPQAPGVVNAWVARKTHDKIKKLVDQFGPGTVGYLVNATYFHALWATEFQKLPAPIEFQKFDGTTASLAAMHRDDTVTVYHNPLYASALLPYKGGRFSAVVILPGKFVTPAEFAAFMSPSVWIQTMQAFRAATGETLNAKCKPAAGVSCDWTMQMPKFTLDYTKDLTQTLHAIGMPIPGASVPDFCGGCFIGDVVQATRIEVDEKGTTAAAATGVGIELSMKAPMLVDRPFAFAIVDNASGAPLFLGAIGNLS